MADCDDRITKLHVSRMGDRLVKWIVWTNIVMLVALSAQFWLAVWLVLRCR